MIKRPMRRSVEDQTIYSIGENSISKNPNLIIYGDVKVPFLVAENIPKWLGCPDKSYHELLEMINDSDRMVKLIMGSDGKSHPKWCVMKDGVLQIIGILFDFDDNWNRYTDEFTSALSLYQGEHYNSSQEDSVSSEEQQRYTISEVLQNPDILINALTRLKEVQGENEQLKEQLDKKSEIISELEPKAKYYDKVLNTENGISPSVIAKEYGKSAKWLNNTLHNLKIQYKQGETWVLYSKYVDKGYTCTKTHQYTDEYGVTRSVMHTYWTQVGRKFIYDILKKIGIEPIE